MVLDSNKRVVWSSNVAHIATNSTAKLLKTGNLVLLDDATGESIWESFQHPCDALVPKLKLSIKKKTCEKVRITSWRSPSDPSLGYYSASLERPNIPEVFYWVNETRLIGLVHGIVRFLLARPRCHVVIYMDGV